MSNKLDTHLIFFMMEEIRDHKITKKLKLDWHILPHPEDPDYLMLFILSPKPKHHYICASIHLNAPPNKEKLRLGVECALMSVEDAIEETEVE